MPQVTITPIPYQSGTLSLNSRKELCAVHVSGNKFLVFYSQATPNFIYAHVVTTTGLDGSTASATNGPQFAFASNASRVMAWKADTNRFFVLMGNDLRVVEIDGSDNITMRNAVATNFHTPILWANLAGVESATDNAAGNTICAIQINTNLLYVLRRTGTGSGNNNSTTFTVAFNPTTDAFTLTAIASGNLAGSGSSDYYEYRCKDIPNSTNKLIYVVMNNGGTFARWQNTPSVNNAVIINSAGLCIRRLNLTNGASTFASDGSGFAAVHDIVPLSDTTFLGLIDGRSYRLHQGSSSQAANASFSIPATGQWAERCVFSGSGANTMVTDSIGLDANHFAISITDPGAVTGSFTSANASNVKGKDQYLRVVKFIDGNYAEVSPATYNGTPLGRTLTMVGDTFLRLSSNNVVFPTKLNATASDMRITLKSVY